MSSITARGTFAPIVELLETRRLLSVALGEDGWTVFGPSSDSRIIYVSSSEGDNTNDGLAPDRAVRTIARAKGLMRHGYPDWMLLKRGDSFERIGRWETGGRNSQEMQLIGAYGEGSRPLIQSGIDEGFVIYGGTIISHVGITGVHFLAHTYDGFNGSGNTAGIRLLKDGTNFIIEDVMVQGYKDNIVVQGDRNGIIDFQLRRSVIVDNFSASSVGHSQGIYFSNTTKNILIEENVFDHNGWNDSHPSLDKRVFNHAMYIQQGTQNVVVRKNIISRASLTGVQLRQGGLVEDNLFLQNAVGVSASNGASTIVNNVFLEGSDLPTTPSGVAIDLINLPWLVAQNNIIANDNTESAVNTSAIQIQWGVRNADISSNVIYNWRRGFKNGGGENIQFHHNQVQDTRYSENLVQHDAPLLNSNGQPGTFYWANTYRTSRPRPYRIGGYEKTATEWRTQAPEHDHYTYSVQYRDANRDIAKYHANIGGEESFDAFIAGARALSKQNWDQKYLAAPVIQYIRTGFTPTTAVPGTGLGLFAEYFASGDFTGPAFTRQERELNFDFQSSPVPSMPSDVFSARWTGQVQVPTSGGWNFITEANDGVRLWINGQLVIDRWYSRRSIEGDANLDGVVDMLDFNILSQNFSRTGMSWEQGDFNGDSVVDVLDFNYVAQNFSKTGSANLRDSGAITLEAGQKYEIRIEYVQKYGSGSMKLLWQNGTGGEQMVPASSLSSGDSLSATSDLLKDKSNKAGKGKGRAVA